MGKLRSLAFEERKAYNRRIQQDINEISDQVIAGKSKSQIKKMKADQHNKMVKWIQDNQIVRMMGRVFTERETPIDGVEFITEIKP